MTQTAVIKIEPLPIGGKHIARQDVRMHQFPLFLSEKDLIDMLLGPDIKQPFSSGIQAAIRIILGQRALVNRQKRDENRSQNFDVFFHTVHIAFVAFVAFDQILHQ